MHTGPTGQSAAPLPGGDFAIRCTGYRFNNNNLESRFPFLNKTLGGAVDPQLWHQMRFEILKDASEPADLGQDFGASFNCIRSGLADAK